MNRKFYKSGDTATVKDVISAMKELHSVRFSFDEKLLPFATDAKVSFIYSMDSYYELGSFRVRIEGTTFGFANSYDPGEHYERPASNTVRFESNLFENNGTLKKAERLSRLFNLPVEVVKALNKNIDYCQIFFLLAERIKNGGEKVSILNLGKFPFATLMSKITRAKLEHLGISKEKKEKLREFISNNKKKTKKILCLSNYLIWVATGNDTKSYITAEMEQDVLEKYNASIEEQRLDELAQKNAEQFDISKTLARFFGNYDACYLFSTHIGHNDWLKDDAKRELRASLTSSDFEEQKTALCEVFTIMAGKTNSIYVDTINKILDVMKKLVATSRKDTEIVQEMVRMMLG